MVKALDIFIRHLINMSFEGIFSFCGDFSDLETVISVKNFFVSFGCSNLNVKNIKNLINNDFRGFFLLIILLLISKNYLIYF